MLLAKTKQSLEHRPHRGAKATKSGARSGANPARSSSILAVATKYYSTSGLSVKVCCYKRLTGLLELLIFKLTKHEYYHEQERWFYEQFRAKYAQSRYTGQ